jgi:sterol desaturase/sphingolipid hydroxylase (fatty acid hydroxylase superfamily)
MTADTLIRIAGFVGAFVVLATWEMLAPRRTRSSPRARRWSANLGVVLLDTVVVRVLFVTGAIGAAVVAAEHGWGLLNRSSWPTGIELLLAVIALDFALYLQHVVFHAVPVLWRLHMMHHADLDCDVTTGVRFHPLEVMLSMVIKVAAVVLVGASPAAVLVFEVLLNATSMFNHSNVRIPLAVERVVRLIMVTPDMHRTHHSIRVRETNSNFGFNLSWWDRVFGTYRAEPQGGQTEMVLGLEQFRDPSGLTLHRILLMPFTESPGRYPLSHD